MRETITVIRDDIDGTEGAQSYTFALGKDQYEIDLNDANYKKLESALEPFVKVGAKVTARVPRERGSAAPKGNREELQRVREWAKGQGLKVAPRGRISGDVMDAYRQSQ